MVPELTQEIENVLPELAQESKKTLTELAQELQEMSEKEKSGQNSSRSTT